MHWSSVGNAHAPDQAILAWAEANGYVVFTHDLDFGAILTATRAKSPSVLQVRTQDVNPYHMKNLLVSVIELFREQLVEGCLISVDQQKARVRILPTS